MLDYQKQQAAFAAHIRNPEQHAVPLGVEDRRMGIYRNLFFNNIESFLSGGFPVLHSLFSDTEWLQLVRDFMTHHQAQTPYFLEISLEFLRYLDDESLALHQRFPFACELAHYEWVELALDVETEADSGPVDANGDLLEQSPVLSPLAWPLVYQWPVHLIGPGHLPQQPAEQPVCLVVYRNRQDKVEFLEANPVTIRLLEIIQQENQPSGREAFTQLAAEMQRDDVENLIRFGLPILEQLRAQGILLGTRAA